MTDVEKAAVKIQNKFWRSATVQNRPKLSNLLKCARVWNLQNKSDEYYSVVDSALSMNKVSQRCFLEHKEECKTIFNLLLSTARIASGKVISLSSELGKTMSLSWINESAFSFNSISEFMGKLDTSLCREMIMDRCIDTKNNIVDAMVLMDVEKKKDFHAQLVMDIFVSLFIFSKTTECKHTLSRLESDAGWLMLRAKASAIWSIILKLEKKLSSDAQQQQVFAFWLAFACFCLAMACYGLLWLAMACYGLAFACFCLAMACFGFAFACFGLL